MFKPPSYMKQLLFWIVFVFTTRTPRFNTEGPPKTPPLWNSVLKPRASKNPHAPKNAPSWKTPPSGKRPLLQDHCPTLATMPGVQPTVWIGTTTDHGTTKNKGPSIRAYLEKASMQASLHTPTTAHPALPCTPLHQPTPWAYVYTYMVATLHSVVHQLTTTTPLLSERKDNHHGYAHANYC